MSWLPRNHVAQRRMHLNATPEEVFALISGPQNWRPDVAKWERTGDHSYVETGTNGGRMPFEVLESERPTRRVTRIADDTLPFGGTWTWQITPTNTGCEVEITENGFVPNLIFRFLAKYAFGHHRTMDNYLRNLKAQLEWDSKQPQK